MNMWTKIRYNRIKKKVDKMDTFLSQRKCDRCGNELTARIMSWFNNDTICLQCSGREDEIKHRITENGENPSDYEGCGFIPFSGE